MRARCGVRCRLFPACVDPPRARAANGEAYSFKIDEFRKHCLLNGLDDIGLTLAKADLIAAFETRHLREQPWFNGIGLKATAAR